MPLQRCASRAHWLAQGGRRTEILRSRLGADEGRGLLAPSPAGLDAKHDEKKASGARQIGVVRNSPSMPYNRLAAHMMGFLIRALTLDHTSRSPELSEGNDVRPCHKARLLHITSIRRPSLIGTSTFISAMWTLPVGRAPPSRQTRASTRFSTSARVGSTRHRVHRGRGGSCRSVDRAAEAGATSEGGEHGTAGPRS